MKKVDDYFARIMTTVCSFIKMLAFVPGFNRPGAIVFGGLEKTGDAEA
jgi:hypothetical protein